MIVAWAVGWPGAVVLRDIATTQHAWDAVKAGAMPGLLARTAVTAVVIGLVATAAAVPVASLLHRGRSVMWVVLPAALLMPPYLAYAGWGQLRAPGTWLGDLMIAAAADGARWLPVWVGRLLAVLGLALWAMPLAAITLWVGLATENPSIGEALRLDTRSRVRRAWQLVQVRRWVLGGAVGAVSLVMLGSAVPLHLAQLETASIVAWRQLALTPPDRWGEVWLGAWPMLAVAVGAGWIIGGRLVRAATRTPDLPPRGEVGRSSRTGVIAAWAVWLMAVVVPAAILVGSMESSSSLRTFWRISGSALADSARTGAMVSALALVIAATTSVLLTAGGAGRLAVSLAARALLVAALVPGVLVGAAVATSGYSGTGALVAAQLARFGFVPIAVVCWMAWAEPAERRALRRLDDRGTIRAWIGAVLPVQAGGIAASASAVFALSVHEIEATVIVAPPGKAGIAPQILEYLHFNRLEAMSAASVYLVGGGLAVAMIAAGLARISAGAGRMGPR